MSDVLERRLKMRPVTDPAVRAVTNLFVAGAHVMDRFDAITATEELSHPAFNVLRILRGQPDGHPRGEIAQRLVYRNSDVTRIIDRLVKRGLVRRVRSTADRRLSLAAITPEGLAVLARLDPLIARLYERYRRRCAPGDLVELSRLLEGLYADDL